MKHHYYKRQGFTLAEVLITLGIIGVVAALTLTTVIPEIQNKQNIAKWKKEYSVMDIAFQKVVNDGVSPCMYYANNGTCTYGSDGYNELSAEFMDGLKKELKVVDWCSANGLNGKHRCDNYGWDNKNSKYKWAGIAEIYSRYNPLGVKSFKTSTNLDSGAVNSYNFNKYAYLLNDGTAVYFGGLWDGPWIVVDVNNFNSGPNQVGKDVFVIKAYVNTKTNTYWLKPAGASGTPNWNNSASGSSGCSKDVGLQQTNKVYDAAGAGCSAKYLLE